MSKLRTYFDLQELESFEERFEYLKLSKKPTEETFGSLRQLNQRFYASSEWLYIRAKVITRDGGCEFGLYDYPISGRIIVHHMNPITPHILVHSKELVLDPEYLITVSEQTHLALHYGLAQNRPTSIIHRSPGDTRLW